jgi:hypothetical protein
LAAASKGRELQTPGDRRALAAAANAAQIEKAFSI